MFRIAAVVTILLLVVNGVLHGIWSHRWDAWSDETVQSFAARIDGIPLQVGDWEGTRLEIDPLTHPTEMVGQGLNVRYVNRIDGTAIIVYLACGPTGGLVSHTPQACYTSNGYTCIPPDIRVPVMPPHEGLARQFWVSNFTRSEAAIPTYLRVFWSWSDGKEWQTPGNPRRTYRQQPVIYKCYALRQTDHAR